MIEACDNALKEKNAELKISDIAIQQCKQSNADMRTEIEDLRDANNSIWRNPFVMMLLGGAAVSTAYLLLRK